MADIFGASERWDPVAMPDADVKYLSRNDWGDDDLRIRHRLFEETAWRREQITLWGKAYAQPRLSAWYGDPDARYKYSSLDLEPLPWTHLLGDLKQRVETLTGAHFNGALLNYYRDHNDSMGAHSDDEPELGPAPIIASLSFGETRVLTFKHRQRADLKPVRLALASGSLLLMRGATQRYWKHGISKQTRPCGPRVNLTFRRIIPLALR